MHMLDLKYGICGTQDGYKLYCTIESIPLLFNNDARMMHCTAWLL